MLSIRAIFVRYCSIHRRILLRARNIGGRHLGPTGRVERVNVVGNQIEIEGWSRCSDITVSHDGHAVALTPSQLRPDVKAVFPGSGAVGFMATLPFRRGAIMIEAATEDQQFTLLFGRFIGVRSGLETLRLAALFTFDSLRAIPALVRWYRAGSASLKALEKQHIKSILRLNPLDHVLRPAIEPHVFGAPQPISTKPQCVTIILPVYNAFDVLQVCIEKVFQHTDVAWHLILIEDCSTDPRVKPYLTGLAAGENSASITLLQNAQNLGFVGAVNRGFEAALKRGAPVVLLNSDALVPQGWASRLIAPLNDNAVASVTPLSNDAEILSVPFITTTTQLREADADTMDHVAQHLLSGASPVKLPTGVGFCMAISPDWLRRVPQFDPAFGRGYGEEVDWCRKTMALGGIHVAQPALFVEHRGGQSFGVESKLEHVATNNQIVSARYPDYDAKVQEFIHSDPLVGARMVLALAWATGQQIEPMTVLIAHAMGGGADDASERHTRELLAIGQSVVVLRLGGRARYEIILSNGKSVMRATTDRREDLDHIFSALKACRFVYGCGVGDPDPVFLPDWLVAQTGKNPESSLEIQFHDFFPISPSYNLLDEDGTYRGVPIGGETTDPAHAFVRSDNSVVSLAEWQDAWGRALSCASIIEVYSASSAKIVTQVWPGCADQLCITSHAALFDVARVTRVAAAPPKVIGILGNIGYQKGAKVVSDLAAFQKRNKEARIVVIGNVDPQYAVVKPAIVHGNYARADIAKLAESYAIDCWLIPSIWPETFSFTTHEALATQLPVWCFDLGGQADAVRGALVRGARGGVIPLIGEIPNSSALSEIILASE